jgi:hypothetical protein
MPMPTSGDGIIKRLFIYTDVKHLRSEVKPGNLEISFTRGFTSLEGTLINKKASYDARWFT